MSNNFGRRTFLKAIGLSAAAMATPGCTVMSRKESAAMRRFRLLYNSDWDNELSSKEFQTEFRYSPAVGLGYEEGVARRDPTGVIKVSSLYYVWYTKTPKGLTSVGFANSTDKLRAYTWDLASIWYATSPDGKTWTERGEAVSRGPKGSFDERSVFTPDILVADGRYYLFYQAVPEPYKWKTPYVIAMSWADSPDGPWTKAPEPIVTTGQKGEWAEEPEEIPVYGWPVKVKGAWDSHAVHDPSLIVREGKYWLYYKGAPQGIGGPGLGHKRRDRKWGVPIAWGVAIADKPEGPYVKSPFNPVICGGHEVKVWPYREGVCALVNQGPERNTIQYAEDGLNFYVKAHVEDIPRAAGVYRVGNFTDTDKKPGQGITWGLSHVTKPWPYLQRFDCDLSLKRANRLRGKI